VGEGAAIEQVGTVTIGEVDGFERATVRQLPGVAEEPAAVLTVIEPAARILRLCLITHHAVDPVDPLPRICKFAIREQPAHIDQAMSGLDGERITGPAGAGAIEQHSSQFAFSHESSLVVSADIRRHGPIVVTGEAARVLID